MSRPLTALALTNGHPEPPFCEKCKRVVESFEWETPVTVVPSDRYFREMVHTGEIIVTIRCHGEEWAMSNFRGRIEPERRDGTSATMRTR